MGKKTEHQVRQWAGPQGALGVHIRREVKKTLGAYRAQPRLVDEHANIEDDTVRGGYAHRQLLELVQNSADALANAQHGGRIDVRLVGDYLYCADDGKPIDEKGVDALMASKISPKRGTNEIGRFGVGFKSVLGLTDAPEFFSQGGSFRFQRGRSEGLIRAVVPGRPHYPALRTPEPMDPREYADEDKRLQKLMKWATNIVRLKLKDGAAEDLVQQLHGFDPEFLLFVPHVRQLRLRAAFEDTESAINRTLKLAHNDGVYLLADDENTSKWKIFRTECALSAEARADRRATDDAGEVPLWWGAPLDGLSNPGYFWAFFPTKTASLVAGILNAPWKTNEDRQNLLEGPYNDELIKAAATLVVQGLPGLAAQDDPARHLDALPRRQEAGDTKQAELLRGCLFSELAQREIVPDQDGVLCLPEAIGYPPKELAPDDDAMKMWAAYAGRPADWLHPKAMTRNRLAKIDQLFESAAPRASVAQWLEALFENKSGAAELDAAKVAIRIAASIHANSKRMSTWDWGNIVLTAAGERVDPDPEHLFLPDGDPDPMDIEAAASFVHADLAADPETHKALETLGVAPPNSKDTFRRMARRVYSGDEDLPDALHEQFWIASRRLSAGAALDLLRAGAQSDCCDPWQPTLRVRTLAGTWRSPYAVLLPGAIVPGDGSRDAGAAVDVHFHAQDEEILTAVGVTDLPAAGRELSWESAFVRFFNLCVDKYQEQDDLPRTPRRELLRFKSTKGVGPLDVMEVLSDEGRQLFTERLLSLDDTYDWWTMRHTGVNSNYPETTCWPLQFYMLQGYGRINVGGAVVPLADAFGSRPRNPAARDAVLRHPRAAEIKEAFDIAEPEPEFIRESDPTPLADVWPGLAERLPAGARSRRLIRCERILAAGQERDCLLHDDDIYLAYGTDEDELRQLQLVSEALALELPGHDLEAALEPVTSAKTEALREAVREQAGDAERLLTAVGAAGLQDCLPASLHAYLAASPGGDDSPRGIESARAAIAIYDNFALERCRRSLARLDPPQQWAGSSRAVEFVQSLGFSARWAGERNKKRPPFIEVEGPYELPPLHGYQKTIVANIRRMLSGEDGGARRGMVSMPTGSGKTRVAVQAIVAAMRAGRLGGGVIWVADRGELCEQAVEAWRQVWSNIGSHAPLRISRMWGGQPQPLPTNEPHVVVATIQTLISRLERQGDASRFLLDSELVVFDEAHRSVAPSFTSVMQEIGMTRRQEEDEPFLIGLTATPYRGYNEDETRWLANRYGKNRLDHGAFKSDDPQDVVIELQEMEVLAQADEEVIEGGTFRLEEDELDEMAKFAGGAAEAEQGASLAWLPQSAENRIAHDAERTGRIIEACQKPIAAGWPTLIFATSVEHAEVLAALLDRSGVKARPVSAYTEAALRRRAVEEFRRGDLKALVNYGVFREGFDAPKTRAIVVARPVYSPNLYFQMIGRGLRGPKNGGDARCLILNVRDNIENYERALAFSELDWLWAKRRGR